MSVTNGHKLTSLPGGILAVDGTPLPLGSGISESRKRLPCNGGCGHIFASNRETFVGFRGRRYCFGCAAEGRVK